MVSFETLGTKIGHRTLKTEKTGCTVLIFDKPAVCGVSITGAAPGTRETDSLDPTALVNGVDAILLTGGSAFGLASADGVMRYLHKEGRGFRVRDDNVPIVPGAVIYDRGIGKKSFPSSNDGYRACEGAGYDTPASGQIGGGTGATVGKWSDRHLPSSGGLSAIVRKFGNLNLGIVIVVNSYGNVVDPASGISVSGAKDKSGNIIPFSPKGAAPSPMGNTIIGAIVTDANLTKSEAKRVAMAAHDGIARAVYPSHTMYDGDTLFVASTGKKKGDINLLCGFAADITAEGILKAVAV